MKRPSTGTKNPSHRDAVLLLHASVELLLQDFLPPVDLLKEQQLLVEHQLTEVSQLQLPVQMQLPVTQQELRIKLTHRTLHLVVNKHIHRLYHNVIQYIISLRCSVDSGRYFVYFNGPSLLKNNLKSCVLI